jgi:hypothetical protein
MKVKVINWPGDEMKFQKAINDEMSKDVIDIKLSTCVDESYVYYTALIIYKDKEKKDNGK